MITALIVTLAVMRSTRQQGMYVRRAALLQGIWHEQCTTTKGCRDRKVDSANKKGRKVAETPIFYETLATASMLHVQS